VLLATYYSGDQIEKIGMNGAQGTNLQEERFMQGLVEKRNLKE
jgi:hypothetical protein